MFVFYFQGAQGDDPITAGIKLTPMAIGMLISSPIAGAFADRHGSRGLAAAGMLVSDVALALMTTLQAHSPYWQSTLWLLLVGIGSGMFNSPNTAAMMGAVSSHRRGIAAGARTMLQNTGAVISIALVLAIATAAVPKQVVRRRQILEEAFGHIARQLELVRRRRDEIAHLEEELVAQRGWVRDRLRELERDRASLGADRS